MQLEWRNFVAVYQRTATGSDVTIAGNSSTAVIIASWIVTSGATPR